MQRKSGFLSAFLVVFFLCVLILTLSLSGKLKFLSFLEKPISAMQSLSYNLFQRLSFVAENPRIKRLKEANLELLSRVASFEKLKQENAALSDQFQTTYPPSYQLLQAQIIGAPSFVPGVSIPSIFIINKGQKDNLKPGMAAVIKNNLIGVISQVSANIAKINLVNNSSLSFTAKTQNGAVGVVKGGENLTIDNVLLSENVTRGELVMTKGDIDSSGMGIPPDLIVGKIISVEKNPSSLFQKAKIENFVNLANLTFIFVYLSAQ